MADTYWQGRRVLVTGAGGFVGSWLTRALVDRHADVTVILRDEAAQSNLHMWGARPSINDHS